MSYAGDLSPQQAWTLLSEQPAAQLVDVRTQAEWVWVGAPDLAELGKETVRIEWSRWPEGGANLAFLDELAAAGVEPGDPVLFLCRSGVRSVAAAQAATAAGYRKAYNVLEGFEGGLDAAGHRGVGGWKASGLNWRQS